MGNAGQYSIDGLDAVLETMLDSVIVIDRSGVVLGWNDVAVTTFGWTQSEAIGKSLDQLIVPHEHRESHRSGIQRYLATGEARVLRRRIEISAVDKAGRKFPVELAIVNAPGDSGAAFVGFLRDISERRTTADQLSLSEESLRLATEAAEVGTWDLDLKTNQLSWSDRTKAMFGISPHVQCDMDDFYQGLHPIDRAATERAFLLALDVETRATYDVQYRTIGKEDGVVRWVAAKGRGLFNEDGECIRAVGTAIDITARKVAEARHAFMLQLTDVLRGSDTRAALHEASALMGSYFGVARVGYGHLDPDEDVFDYDVCWTDGNVQPLLGRFPARAFGAKIVAKLSAGETVIVDDLLSDPVSDETETRKTAAEVDTRAILVVPFVKAGRLRTIVYLNDRPPRRWEHDEIAFMEEVAERTRQVIARGEAEAALHQLNATLESRIEERTIELREAEAALRQSQKMDAVGQLTGGIAHDFNNLLTIITGNLEMISRRLGTAAEPRLSAWLENATKGAERAAALTQRLLAFSRQRPLASRSVDVAASLAGMSDLLAGALGETVVVRLEPAHDLWHAEVDPNELENSILNLAVNARDAMPEGGQLTIAVQNVHFLDDDESMTRGDYVVLSVADTGSGMPETIVARAPEPFFTTKEVGKGTGLGLSMVYGFVRQSGGDLIIESAPGEGTTVRLFLPRASIVDPDAASDHRTIPQAQPGEMILVVEDDDAVRALSVQSLLELGYEVFQAASGPAALALLSTTPVHLLFSDVVMPDMSGRALAEAASSLQPEIRTLFTSGYTKEEFGAETGVTLLPKPFTFTQLARAVREVLD